MAERPLTRRKGLGSYYTTPDVVEFLVGWGMRAAPGVVMDPSCGDGRFLAAAGLRGASALIGCDLDDEALPRAARALEAIPLPSELYDADFFRLEPDRVGAVDLVVGNPPFIRYQQFSGESRARALASALRVGARLSRLSASWAPFILHALQFLRPRGAMAMVVPAEVAQTSYGVETLRALCANFARVRLITFRHNWFEGAQQETFLLLAEGRGGASASAELIPLDRIGDLEELDTDAVGGVTVPVAGGPDAALGLAFLDGPSRDLIAELFSLPAAVALQSVGDVANGYVSGANDFFHCTLEQARARNLPSDWLLPVARNSRSLSGLTFSIEDLAACECRGAAHHLILPRDDDLFSLHGDALDAFCSEGERSGIPDRYKCRVRSPWWRVPGLIEPDVLLPYMIGREPHAAVDRCHALYSNSLHGIRLSNAAAAERVAFGLLCTASLLSMELSGRSYGGGVLKLEPTEMQRVRLIAPTCSMDLFRERFQRADRLLRDGEFESAVDIADQTILTEQVGLPDADLVRIRRARATLLERRLVRSRSVP